MNTELKHRESSKELISDKLSNKYAPVNTELLIQPFVDKGWYAVKTVKNKHNTKDWVTLEHDDFRFLNGDTVRIEVRNSYDGSSSLMLMGGIGRIVCSNGLVIGTDFESFRFRHSGTRIYTELENAYEKIVAKLHQLKEKVNALNNIYLSPVERIRVLNNIYSRVVSSNGDKVKTELTLVPNNVIDDTFKAHRIEDEGLDAWSMLNVVQENIVRHGVFECIVTNTDKESGVTEKVRKTKRGSEGKLSSLELNKIISDEFLKVVA